MVEAVVCLSGDGLARVLPSVQLARLYNAHLVLAGSRDAPPEAYHWVDVLPHTTSLPASRVVCVDAENTWEQGVNVIAECRKRGWECIILVASGWHILRAFATFIKALGGVHDVRILPYRVDSRRMDTAGFLLQETAKIALYRMKGHCATETEVSDYMAWLGS